MTRTVAVMALREIGRRRSLLVLMIALPLSFYLVRRELTGQSIRFLALGLGWAVATLGLFTAGATARSTYGCAWPGTPCATSWRGACWPRRSAAGHSRPATTRSR